MFCPQFGSCKFTEKPPVYLVELNKIYYLVYLVSFAPELRFSRLIHRFVHFSESNPSVLLFLSFSILCCAVFLCLCDCPRERVDGQQLEQEPEPDLDTYREDFEQQPYEEGKWFSPLYIL